jgi:hypothetical protein
VEKKQLEAADEDMPTEDEPASEWLHLTRKMRRRLAE